jgi:hypothetical protein
VFFIIILASALYKISKNKLLKTIVTYLLNLFTLQDEYISSVEATLKSIHARSGKYAEAKNLLTSPSASGELYDKCLTISTLFLKYLKRILGISISFH